MRLSRLNSFVGCLFTVAAASCSDPASPHVVLGQYPLMAVDSASVPAVLWEGFTCTTEGGDSGVGISDIPSGILNFDELRYQIRIDYRSICVSGAGTADTSLHAATDNGRHEVRGETVFFVSTFRDTEKLLGFAERPGSTVHLQLADGWNGLDIGSFTFARQ